MSYTVSRKLDSLPPEIRSNIYPFVFSTLKRGFISLLVEKNRDLSNVGGLPQSAVLRRDARYIAYRQQREGLNRGCEFWPENVENAFLQGSRTPDSIERA